MCDHGVLQSFFQALTCQEYEKVAGMLCEDFRYSGGTAVPLNRQQWLWLFKTLAQAMPDLTVEYRFEKAAFGVVSGQWEIRGTQTADFDLHTPGFPKLRATGRLVVLAGEKIEIALEGDRVKTMRVKCSHRSSFSALLNQISRASEN